MGRPAGILMLRTAQCCVLLAAAALTACGGDHRTSSTDVVARVNDRDITLDQLARALQAQDTSVSSPHAVEQTVESLVDEQLLVAEALAHGFHREPGVAEALGLAHDQALARLYAQRIVFPQEPLDDEVLLDYYYTHPELFSQRRIYQVIAYVLQQSDLSKYLQADLKSISATKRIPEVLHRHGVAYDVRTLTRAAEQLPIEALPTFALARVGDLIVLQPHDGQRTLMLITGIQDSPVDWERALPLIRKYLVDTRNTRALQAHLRQARASAHITYDRRAADSLSAALDTRPVQEAAPARARIEVATAALNNRIQTAVPLSGLPAAPASDSSLQSK